MTGPGPAPSRAGNARVSASVAARTTDPVPPGESRSPRAVKLAFPVRHCGWLGTSWPCTSQPKQAWAALRVAKVAVFSARWVSLGPWHSGGGALRPLRAVHWAFRALTLAYRANGVRGRGRGSGGRKDHGGGGRGCPAIGSGAGSRSAGRRSAACGLVAEEGAETLQARGKPGVASLGGNRVTVMARECRSSHVLLGANRITRHVRSGVRVRDPAALLILRQLT